jgi:hypothetical protein
VVPFSTVAPYEIEPHHHEILAGTYDFFDPAKSSWAKCDMLTCVCFERLDRLMLYGRYQAPTLKEKDLKAIQLAVSKALLLDGESVIVQYGFVPDQSGLGLGALSGMPSWTGRSHVSATYDWQMRDAQFLLQPACELLNKPGFVVGPRVADKNLGLG